MLRATPRVTINHRIVSRRRRNSGTGILKGEAEAVPPFAHPGIADRVAPVDQLLLFEGREFSKPRADGSEAAGGLIRAGQRIRQVIIRNICRDSPVGAVVVT